MTDPKPLVRRLLAGAGETYAEESGIRLKDTPKPLFQLLVLAMLASKPIGADIAADAGRELFKTGLRTPRAVVGGDRRTVIAAFGRAGYARYDESSATRLCDMARRVLDSYGGDLRKLAADCTHQRDDAVRALKQFKGIGDTGADVFMREVQQVWPWVRPYYDQRALAAAGDLGLPTSPARLSELARGKDARLAVALVRVSLNEKLRDSVIRSTNNKEQ